MAAPPARRRRRPEARWSPPFATAVVIAGLVAGQAVALGVALAAGGEDGPDWVIAASLLLADAVVLAMVFWFTGSLLPCIALHALNNALVTGIGLGWDWEVPLLVLGSVAVALGLLWPISRERAPQAQQA